MSTSDRSLPTRGSSPEQLWAELDEIASRDVDWAAGRLQGAVYAVGDDVREVAQQAFRRFFVTSPLATRMFPSMQRLEDDLIAMTAGLLHAPAPVGTVTTGGTESNFLAMLAAREWAKRYRLEVERPEVLLPLSAHPSFNKAAHFLGLTPTRVPTGPDLRADPEAIRRAVNRNTVMLVGSAPSYTHGVLDPIPELAEIAAEHELHFHVDACVGGFFLPFLEKLGRPVERWDFRVEGVHTISADLHKHGYGARGASVIFHRDPERQKLHSFEWNGWPNGRYFTRTIGGTRAGGAFAAAWAVMKYLGEEGYLRITERSMRIAEAFQRGIGAIPGLEVWGRPIMTKFGYGSRAIDITAVADELERRGWFVGRQQWPPGINMHVLPVHEPIVEPYLQDLARAAALTRTGAITTEGKAASYV